MNVHLSELGQGLLEYSLVLVFIAVVVVAALALIAPELGNIFSTVASCVPPTAACPYT